MLGPFATASRRTPIHQVSLLSHARIDVHDNDDNDNDNVWQRGPLWPHRMVPMMTSCVVDLVLCVRSDLLYTFCARFSWFWLCVRTTIVEEIVAGKSVSKMTYFVTYFVSSGTLNFNRSISRKHIGLPRGPTVSHQNYTMTPHIQNAVVQSRRQYIVNIHQDGSLCCPRAGWTGPGASLTTVTSFIYHTQRPDRAGAHRRPRQALYTGGERPVRRSTGAPIYTRQSYRLLGTFARCHAEMYRQPVGTVLASRQITIFCRKLNKYQLISKRLKA